MTRDDLLQELQDNNVAAFLRVLREGESSQEDDAYTVMFGGSHFEGFEDHPHQVNTVNGLSSSAAGAYQFLAKTWQGLYLRYGFPDFSPINQDCGAVALIAGRDALEAVKRGDLDEAIARCAKEWASLPGSPYGQPTLTLERCRQVFAAYGGTDRSAAQPVSGITPADAPQTEVTMAPAIPIILQGLASLIPALGQLFGGSEVAQRNTAAAGIIAAKLTEVTNSVNVMEAAEKIKNDPAVREEASRAVNDLLPQLGEAGGGGLAGARESNNSQSGDWRKLLFSLPFVGILVFTPTIWAVVAAAVFKSSFLIEMDPQLRGTVIGFVMGTLAGSICGYIYGSAMKK